MIGGLKLPASLPPRASAPRRERATPVVRQAAPAETMNVGYDPDEVARLDHASVDLDGRSMRFAHHGAQSGGWTSAGEVYLTHYTHRQLSHGDAGIPTEKTSRIGLVAVKMIDSMNLSDVSFIKIDTEGFALPVIEGALETITHCRPLILVEQNGNEELHFGRPRDEATDFLQKLGMQRHPEEPRVSKD